MELLIVVVVVAILAAVVVVAYQGVSGHAKRSAAVSAASQSARKITSFAVTNGGLYPPSLADAGVVGGSTRYQYRVDNDATPPAFCVTATTHGLSFRVSNTDAQPVRGACAGHAVDGGVTVTNYAKNPMFRGSSGPQAFGAGVTGLQIVEVEGVRYAQGRMTGAAAAGIRLSTYADRWVVTGGQQVSARVTVRNANGEARGFQLSLLFFDAAGAASGNQVAAPKTPITVVSPGESRTFSLSARTPAAAASVTTAVSRANGDGAAAGDLVQATEVWLSDVDESAASGDSPGWIWNGEPHNATSTGPPL